MTVRGLLLGRTCCSIAYGQQWLKAALTDQGTRCGDCGTGTFCFLTCCPEVIDPPECPTGPDRADRPSETSQYADFFRTSVDAGQAAGPTILERIGQSCGCGGCTALEVEFVLAMGPYMFADPVVVIDGALLADGETVERVLPYPRICPTPEPCPPLVLCNEDPLCPSPPMPPQPPRPEPPCDAFQPTGTVKLTSYKVEAGDVRAWSDAVIEVTITAGDQPLRDVKVAAYLNELDFDPDYFGDCDACGLFVISYIPPGATFRFDGAARTARMQCMGNAEQDASRSLKGLVSFPVLDCRPWTLCVEVDESQVDGDATVTVAIVPRES